MSCKDDRWYPVDLNANREPHLAENTFNIRNESKIFRTEQCIFGNGGKYGVVAINGAYPAKPIEVTEGALVHIKIKNELMGGVSPTIHWHGFKMDQGYFW